MQMRIALTTLLFLMSFFLFAQVKDISTQSAKKKLKKEIIVLDVRTGEEYKSGHIEGAVNYDVLDSTIFLTQIEKLDKDKTYLVYCRSGKRSADAASIMDQKGFSNVFNMKGGILAWQKKKYKVSTNK